MGPALELFAALVAERCAAIAACVPLERAADRYRDTPQKMGAETADAIRSAFPMPGRHRPVENGPAQMARFHDGTVVEQYWVHGVRLLRQDVQLSQELGDDRIGSSDAYSTAILR